MEKKGTVHCSLLFLPRPFPSRLCLVACLFFSRYFRSFALLTSHRSERSEDGISNRNRTGAASAHPKQTIPCPCVREHTRDNSRLNAQAQKHQSNKTKPNQTTTFGWLFDYYSQIDFHNFLYHLALDIVIDIVSDIQSKSIRYQYTKTSEFH